MFTLPILPDELRIPLDVIDFRGEVITKMPGCVAVCRPLDLEAASKWYDARETLGTFAAALALLRTQLIRIEGLGMHDPLTGQTVPFDPKNEKHIRSLDQDAALYIQRRVRERAELDPVTEKNSGLPSDSGGTMNGESIHADPAQAPQGTD